MSVIYSSELTWTLIMSLDQKFKVICGVVCGRCTQQGVPADSLRLISPLRLWSFPSCNSSELAIVFWGEQFYLNLSVRVRDQCCSHKTALLWAVMIFFSNHSVSLTRHPGTPWETFLCICSTTYPPHLSSPLPFTVRPSWSGSAKYHVVRSTELCCEMFQNNINICTICSGFQRSLLFSFCFLLLICICLCFNRKNTKEPRLVQSW